MWRGETCWLIWSPKLSFLVIATPFVIKVYLKYVWTGVLSYIVSCVNYITIRRSRLVVIRFTQLDRHVRFRFMVFNATFNNSSAISWRSLFIHGENRSIRRKPPTCRKLLTMINTVVRTNTKFICCVFIFSRSGKTFRHLKIDVTSMFGIRNNLMQ
jgi:hypothetical protein